MVSGISVFGWLRNTVVGLFVAAILTGIFLPVYTDEVGWRFQERAGLDGVDKLFNDMCGPNTLARPPFFMMPVRYYSAFFNTSFADPLYVRLSGILYALAWLALLLALIRRAAGSMSDRVLLSIISIGLMCLGTLPLLLVWSRPEQPIVLATTAALLLAWTGSQGAPAEASSRIAWLRSIAIVALGAIALSYHLKALFVAPVFLTCLFFASRGRQANAPRMVMAILFVGIVAWSASYWVHRMQCPDDAVLRASYAYNNTGLELTTSRTLPQFVDALGKMIGNVNLIAYFGLVVPHPAPLSNWLEPNQIDEADAFVWYQGLIVVWACAVLLAGACIVVRARDAWRQRRIDARMVLAAVLLASVVGWSATQGHRNVYEACFVLPLVMLAVLFALSGREPHGLIAACARMLAVVVGICAIASLPTVAAIYAPSIVRANLQTGYIAAQRASLPVFGYASVKPDIVGAARKCGIGDTPKAHALMVDDLTYFAFMRSSLPQHQLGVLQMWRGSITDSMTYLRSRGSSGAILGCHLLPDDLRRRAKSQGRFCCIVP